MHVIASYSLRDRYVIVKCSLSDCLWSHLDVLLHDVRPAVLLHMHTGARHGTRTSVSSSIVDHPNDTLIILSFLFLIVRVLSFLLNDKHYVDTKNGRKNADSKKWYKSALIDIGQKARIGSRPPGVVDDGSAACMLRAKECIPVLREQEED